MIIRSILTILCIVSAARAQSVTALVAASTQDAMRQVAERFTQRTEIQVRLSAGASNALAQQIIQGAPADLFVSASPQWTDALEEQSLVAETLPLLGNELVIIQPLDASHPVESPADLLDDEIQHIALAGEQVPAGVYAQQALSHHQIYDALIEANRIVRGQDVRTALTYVVRAEADAGIVYASDAMIEADHVKIVHRFSPDSHEQIVYPASLLNSAKESAAARAFFDFLGSAEASEIFRQHGFTPLADEDLP